MGRHADEEESDIDRLEMARKAIEEDKNQRIEGFMTELGELASKYNIEMRTKPVEFEVIALD